MNYYERHIGDYSKDTRWLTTYQHGVFALLLDWYYSNEKAIPVDLIFRIVNARSGPERKAAQEVVTSFFDVDKEPGFAHNKRADLDIAKYRIKQEVNSLKSKKRWDAASIPTASSRHAVGNAESIPTQTPVTSNQEKAKERPASADLFAGVAPQVVADFRKLRQAKKAAITQTAVDGIQREATKAGMTLEAALRMCCERGWTGFKADWVTGLGAAPMASLPGGGRRAL